MFMVHVLMWAIVISRGEPPGATVAWGLRRGRDAADQPRVVRDRAAHRLAVPRRSWRCRATFAVFFVLWIWLSCSLRAGVSPR